MFLAAALGGPTVYRGRTMREVHAGLRTGDADFDRVVSHLAATLTSLGISGPTIGVIAEVLGPLRASLPPDPMGPPTLETHRSGR